MIGASEMNNGCLPGEPSSRGFTLLELLIAMAVGLVAVGAAYAVCDTQLKAHRQRRLALEVQQNLRAALVFVEHEIRLAGFDPEGSGQFGIVDVRRYDLTATGPNAAGQPALFYTVDHDENGALDDRNHNRNKEHCNFRIRRDTGLGRRYLAWDNGAGRHLLSENIHWLGLAYAIDADRDGAIDTWNGGDHVIWAVDSDNDNRLDLHLDTNDDGAIDPLDDADGDGRIGPEDGGVIDPPVTLDRIRMVRVWLMAQSAQPVPGHLDARPYVVGDQVLGPAADGHLRRVLEVTINARNI